MWIRSHPLHVHNPNDFFLRLKMKSQSFAVHFLFMALGVSSVLIDSSLGVSDEPALIT